MPHLLSCNGYGDFAVQKPLHSVPEADLVVGDRKYRGTLTCCPFGMTSKDIQAGAYPHDPQVFFRFETSYQFPSSETLDISDQQLTDIFDGKFTLQLDSNDLIRIVVMESVTSGSSEETPA